MTEIMVTRTAGEQLEALDDADARAVDSAIQAIDKRTGDPIDLPGAPAGTSYLALSSRDAPAGPVIIYRPRLPSEGGGWLVVSLLSPEQYRDMRRAEELVAAEPAVREIVNAVVAGTAATVDVAAHPGSATATNPGAASTTRTGDKQK